MSTPRVIRPDESVDERASERVNETEFLPSVEQETQATVDANHPDGMAQEYSHLPLAQAERVRARKEELEHISAQAALGGQDDRAERTRGIVVERRRTERRIHGRPDPRESLSREDLGRANRTARQIDERVDDGPCRAAVARSLARKLRDGRDFPEAVFETLDEQLEAPAAIILIAEVPDVDTPEVSVEGEIVDLWTPSTHSIQQVGLIADETGKLKFTIWKKAGKRRFARVSGCGSGRRRGTGTEVGARSRPYVT